MPAHRTPSTNISGTSSTSGLGPIAVRAAIAAIVAITACARPDDATSRARDVERRILAPCCLRQTLEDHESDLAHGLRAEIERRTRVGEPVAAIEADLVHRYGEQIRAMPSSWDPRALLGVTVASILAAGGVALWWLLRRRRRPTSPVAPLESEAANADYAARLDDDLLAVD